MHKTCFQQFIVKVVAGYRYKFALVLEHNADNPAECEKSEETPEVCSLDVYEVPWRNVMEVLWDNVDCVGRPNIPKVCEKSIYQNRNTKHIIQIIAESVLCNEYSL